MLPRWLWFTLAAVGLLALSVGLWFSWPLLQTYTHFPRLREFFEDPAAHADWLLQVGERCGAAPFIQPTTGYLGFGYGDSWRPGHRHQGFDIFAPTGLNATPVYAAYPGYLTRQADWVSTVIIRVPADPLAPTRQIWVYYTHMADPEGNSFISAAFPPGTSEVPVEAGTLLGYQGNYSGDPQNPVGIHLHISIVKSGPDGQFLNELDIANTLDPSPYLGVRGNVNADWSAPIVCAEKP